MSRPPGQVIVPASASTSTRANSAGSLSGSNTPRHSRPPKSTSPTVPSSNVSRRRYSPTTSTPVMSTSCSMNAMLRQRVDRLERLFTPGTLPVGEPLLPMECSPLGDHGEGAARQRAGHELPVEADRRGLTRVAGVEMRPSVHALIPVHPDRDPVEEADPRHVPTLRAPADGTGYRPQTTRSASAAMDTRFAQRQVPPI